MSGAAPLLEMPENPKPNSVGQFEHHEATHEFAADWH
jgi:hypothetical protein